MKKIFKQSSKKRSERSSLGFISIRRSLRTKQLALVIFLFVFAGFGSYSVISSQAATANYPCVGAPANEPNGGLYPEPRQFVDSQSWWQPIPGQSGTNHGHTHVGACIPERQTMTDSFNINVRMMLHDVGAIKVYSGSTSVPYTSIVLKDDNVETTQTKLYETGWTCTGTCERWRSATINPAPFTTDGRKEIRFRFFFDVLDGTASARMTASANWQFTLDRASVTAVDDHTRSSYPRSKGWYSKPGSLSTGGYCEADTTSVPLPDAPISGIWNPTVKMVWHGDVEDPKVTSHEVRIDPDFHASPINEGTILRQANGEFNGSISIDTRTLTNGTHKLFLRSTCNDLYNRGSAIHGIQIIPFTVLN